MADMFEYACDAVVKNDTLLDHLRHENFDLGITEVFGFCGIG